MDGRLTVGGIVDALVAVLPADAIALVARVSPYLENLAHVPRVAHVVSTDHDHITNRGSFGVVGRLHVDSFRDSSPP